MRYEWLMRKLLFLAFVAPSIVACGPPYTLVARAVPSPFTRPGCRVRIEHLHAERLFIGDKPATEYVSEKKAESADSFDADVRDSDAAFAQELAADDGSLFLPGAPDNTFVIRPVFTNWEPGFYAYFVSHPSEAHLTVDVLSPSGQLLDRVGIDRRVNASMTNPSSGGRMRVALHDAADALSAYISDNWACAAH